MKTSLYILIAFVFGLLFGQTALSPGFLINGEPAKYTLYALMLLVGISIGADRRSLNLIREQGFRLMVLPLVTIAGTFSAIIPVSMLLTDISTGESLAVGAGFGYYSLSGIIITRIHSETLGIIALLANVIREIITLVFAPVMVVWFGKLAPITAAGATSMDTTLPVITAASGREFSIIALAHGIILTIIVPVLVTTILMFFV